MKVNGQNERKFELVSIIISDSLGYLRELADILISFAFSFYLTSSFFLF